MAIYPFDKDPRVDAQPRIGLVALQADETIEDDFRFCLKDLNIGLHVTRVASAPEVTLDTLGQMQSALPTAVGLLPSARPYEVIAYGCTSGTSTIGVDVVSGIIRSAAEVTHVTDPLTATIAWCRAHHVQKLGMLSPYVLEVSDGLRKSFEAAGIQVGPVGTFNVSNEATVVRIAQSSIVEAATDLCAGQDIDAVFLSCTNLRTASAVPEVAKSTGIPTISSNSALCWHIQQLLSQGGE